MADIADFLLRMIAGDEARARESHYRVLAEASAKRRIIETALAYAAEAEYPDLMGGAAAGFEEAVRILAQPYSADPDFDPEWAL